MAKSNDIVLTKEEIRRFPKTDLHLHLDGSLRLSTILDLAKKDNVDLGVTTEEELAKLIHMGENCSSLEEYLIAFRVTLSVLQTEESLYRVAYELAEDAAAENVRYMEVRYAPVLHREKGLSLTQIIEAVLHGLKAGERDFGVKSGVILSGIRNISNEYSLRLAELAVAYKNFGVVGFDLAGAEANYPAKDHQEAFKLIRFNNINSTCHAGEAYGPESIHQALHLVGAHRIGHGTRLREDGNLLNYVNDHRIPLEVCIKSNVQTGAVQNIKTHPVRFYYDLGIRVTINTDNRLITDTTVTDELYLLHTVFKFSVEDLRNVIINGFKSAFLPYRQKQELLKNVLEEFDNLIDEKTSTPKKL
ncbi:adenosine deaminase [bacterium]|nr:adenosine deaminase [bacterium]